jgi:hypothetical protein
MFRISESWIKDAGLQEVAHPIIPLSREKLFQEKSIDRKPAFFE